MRKSILAMVLLLMSFINLKGQTRGCAHDSLILKKPSYNNFYEDFSKRLKDWRAGHPDTVFLPNPTGSGGSGSDLYIDPGCPRVKYIVPVVFHIVHGSGEQPGQGSNISDAQVQNALDEMNKYYRNASGYGAPAVNTGIQFCLARKKSDGTAFNGITRHVDNTFRNPRYVTDEDTLMNIGYMDDIRYVNVWVVNTILNETGSGPSPYGGYAFRPESNGKTGIIIRFDVMGNAQTCSGCQLHSDSRGGVLTHEMGHFLGLYHPWWNTCSGSDQTNCASNGDLCCDVPQISTQTLTCSSAYSSCYTNPMTAIQINNMMDYTGEDCRKWFTANQAQIMQMTLEEFKPLLASPVNVNQLGLQCCYSSAWFMPDNNSLCKNEDTLTLWAYKYTGANYSWTIKHGNTTVFTKSDTFGFCRYPTLDSGSYSVTLNITRGIYTYTETRKKVFEIIDCGQAVHSHKGNWYFGEYAGLRFTSKGAIKDINPSIFRFPNNINTSEGTISISDSLGNLLFYGGGISDDVQGFRVYMKNYREMPGSPIMGHGSSSGGGIVMPVPGKWKQYYLFTTPAIEDRTYGLRYCHIDMSANGGLGTIRGKDSMVTAPMGAPANSGGGLITTESIAATPKCKGKGYWMVIADYATAYSQNKLRVFSVDTNGINPVQVYNIDYNIVGQFTFSPDGSMFATGDKLFEFNNLNGALTFNKNIYTSNYPFSVCFSADSRKLYVKDKHTLTLWNANNYSLYQVRICQWDLEYPNKSYSFVGEIVGENHLSHMQLGPDGKIYIGSYNLPYLHVLENPNLAHDTNQVNNLGLEMKGPLLAKGGIGGKSRAGLPNIMHSLKVDAFGLDFRAEALNCAQYKFTAGTCCKDNYLWLIDGNSYSGRIYQHTFSGSGYHTISLVADGDTVTKQIGVGIPGPLITGADKICDSSNATFYNSTYNGYCTYKWTVNGGMYSADKNECLVKWQTPGNVKLLVVNTASGCRDSQTVNINFYPALSDHGIDTGTLTVCKGQQHIIHGSNVSGGTGKYNIKWLFSTDGTTWYHNSSDTFLNDTIKLVGSQKTYYRRQIVSGNCQLLSGVFTLIPSISTNQIKLEKTACVKNGNIRIKGVMPVYSTGGIYYNWQYSFNGTDWNNDPAYFNSDPTDTTNLNHYETRINEALWIRRKLSAGSCVDYSNIISLSKPIDISRQPIGTYVCHIYYSSNARFSLDLGLALNGNSTPIFQWQYNASGQWTNMNSCCSRPTDSSITQENGSFAGVAPNSSIQARCLVIACGDTLTSNAVQVVFTGNVQASFDKLPKDTVGTSVTPAIFTAGSSNAKLSWQKSLDRGKNWSFIPNQHDTSLSVQIQDLCGVYGGNLQFDRILYRAYLNNGCSQTTSGHVMAYYGNMQPIVRDDPFDKGKEPSDTIIKGGHLIRNPMLSPDIAVSFSPADNPFISGYTDFMLNPTYGTNYIWVRVKNRGDQTSAPTNLDLHWSMTASGLKWTQNWTANSRNRFYNSKTNQYYPLGGKINPVHISVPSIAPGQVTYIMYAWDPAFMPNPSNYYQIVRKKVPNLPIYRYDTVWHPVAQKICLLARMPHCQNIGQSMSFVEGINTGENCRLNNRIAAKNLILSIIKANMGGPGEVYANDHPIIIRNAKDSGDAILKIKFKAGDAGVGNIVRVVATMDSVLEQRWTAGGSMGTGFNLIEPHRLELTDLSNFSMENISLDTLTEGAIYFDFYLKPVPTGSGTTDYNFDVWQESDKDSMPEGFVRILLNAPNLVQGHNYGEGSMQAKEDKTIKGQKQEKFAQNVRVDKSKITTKDSIALQAYPNPTDGNFTLKWNCACQDAFKVELVSKLGEVVYQVNVTPLQGGNYSVLVPMDLLPDGIYTARIVSDTYSATVKVTLIR